MMACEVTEEVDVVFGITRSNPQFGKGGLPQIFVPNFNELVKNGVLKKLPDQAVALQNYRIPVSDYDVMMNEAAMISKQKESER